MLQFTIYLWCKRLNRLELHSSPCKSPVSVPRTTALGHAFYLIDIIDTTRFLIKNVKAVVKQSEHPRPLPRFSFITISGQGIYSEFISFSDNRGYGDCAVCEENDDSVYGTHIAWCNRHDDYSGIPEKAGYNGYSLNQTLLLSDRDRRSETHRESVWRPERPLHKSVTWETTDVWLTEAERTSGIYPDLWWVR